MSSYDPVKIAHYSKSLKSNARELFDIEYSRSEVECFPSKKGLFFLFLILYNTWFSCYSSYFLQSDPSIIGRNVAQSSETSPSSELVCGIKF